MEEYFGLLEEELDEAYKKARKARDRGLDPEEEPEIPLTEDLAERVEKLAGPEGVAGAIRELEDDYSREDMAFKIAEMIVNDEFGHLPDQEAAEQSVRTCLAIITEGIAAAAPIEGITHVDIKKDFSGTPYLAIYFAGPIRSAGGTAAALAVLTGDFVRQKMNLDPYDPSESEVERAVEEVNIYDESVGLQYSPSEEEVRTAYKNIPVEITGEPTEQETVKGYRDLDRIETNRVRGGAVLAIAEGVLQKAPKIRKHLNNLGLSGWDWLSDLDKSTSEEEKQQDYPKGDKYLDDIIAGRGVFGHPARVGGFRLRYGRARNTGLAAAGFHPATMRVLDDHISVGTQLKTERPGKATAAAPVDSIQGPTLKLKDGTVLQVNSAREAISLQGEVEEILSLGDILLGYGEFLENNHPLMPAGYCPEWWALEVEEAIENGKSIEKNIDPFINPPYQDPSPELAVEISRELGVPLHPAYTYPYHDLDLDEIEELGEWLASGEPKFSDGVLEEIRVESKSDFKRYLEKLEVPHKLEAGEVIVEEESFPLAKSLGIVDSSSLGPGHLKSTVSENEDKETMEVMGLLADFPIREKAPTRIGARMGRPEKTKPRKMSPPVHVLFPIGWAGGSTRNITKASEKGTIEVEVVHKECPDCETVTVLNRCPDCNSRTKIIRYCSECERPTEEEECMACGARTIPYQEREINLKSLLNDSIGNLNESLPDTLKGVKGMTSSYKLPEPLEKGVLRAKHGVYVFKDGTVRFDATDMPLTHFKPREVNLSVEGLKELGYEKDYEGNQLESEDQTVELKVQDVLLSESAADYLLRTAQFVDDLLEKFYDVSPFYEADTREDLVGRLVIGLAPHTSAGITGRIIGFTEANVGYAHPYFHAAKRRNCLPGDTEVFLENPSSLKSSSLEEIFESSGEKRVIDDFGTEAKTVEDAHVLGFDRESGNQRIEKVTKVLRSPAPKNWIEITTKSGRKIKASPDHRVPTLDGIKRAKELDIDDELFTPEEIEVEEDDIFKLDLLELFRDAGVEDVMVRGVRQFIEDRVEEVGGLKKTSERLELRKKTFSNYLYRDSIPLTILEELLEYTSMNLSDIPDCKLAAKGDSVEIERWIEVNEDFMKFIGYYLDEGHSRKSEKEGEEFYQVSLAFGDERVREDMVRTVKESFGLEPSVGDNNLVLSSRLLREFLDEIIELGRNAHEKSVPALIKKLPKKKIRHLLSAYFVGDGSVEKGRLHVCVHSVSRELLKDVSFLLARFGIFSRIKSEEREAGGILLEKYEDRYDNETFETHYLDIRSSYAVRFGEEIGFNLPEKQENLEKSYSKERKPRVQKRGDLIVDPIKKIEVVKNDDDYMYDVEVENTHTFLTDELILSNNCDGDEDALMLLLDGLLNFSQYYLPETRGGKMDAPLVLTPRLDPTEIDDEAHNVDLEESYPLDFYRATLNFEDPGKVSGEVGIVEDRLRTENQYEDIRYTEPHDPSSISAGAVECRYKSLGPMEEKTKSQLTLAEKIRAVDEEDVAERLIENHFIPDLKGNLRAFSRQKFRCASCNEKFRRIPLSGRCTNCGEDLILTVTQGGVEKYMDVAFRVAEDYGVADYVKQRLDLVEEEIESLFESDIQQQLSLADFA